MPKEPRIRRGGGESHTGPGTHEWDIMGQTAAEWCYI